jgi:hypothetical protein
MYRAVMASSLDRENKYISKMNQVQQVNHFLASTVLNLLLFYEV